MTSITGLYTIALRGATFIVPAPGVGTLVVIGISGMFARRRRR
ncbi:MAG: PEP-CTERM sorting domain-containing protein [Phycisphaerales bacterium]